MHASELAFIIPALILSAVYFAYLVLTDATSQPAEEVQS